MLADMDGTITPTPSKSGGFITPISKAPTFEPVQRFLREGGTLVVQTNAGTFPFKQLFDPLKSTLEELYNFDVSSGDTSTTTNATNATDPYEGKDGRFLLSPFSGAALYVSCLDRQTGKVEMKEDARFAKTARNTCCTSFEYHTWGRHNTCGEKRFYHTCLDQNDPCYKDPTTFIPEAHVDELLATIRQVQCRAFALMDEDPTYLPALSRKYRDALPPVVALRRELGAERFDREVLTMDNLLLYGKFLQASHDPMLDLQRVSGGNLVQINILGTLMARFDDLWPEALRDELAAKYSIHIKRQPNSTTISKDQVNKGLPIRYLSALRQREDTDLVVPATGRKVKYCHEFSLRNAIAFGDHPHFTDYPMTQFPPMPFVSVSPKKSEEQLPDWPYKTQMIHVNVPEEEGTAKYLNALVDFCVKNNSQDEYVANNWWKPEYAVQVAKDMVFP